MILDTIFGVAQQCNTFIKQSAAACGLAVCLSLLMLSRVVVPAQAAEESGSVVQSETISQTLTSFRVRSDFDVSLNAAGSWANEEGAEATVYADRPFRIRFEIENPGGASSGTAGFSLQYSYNGGEWSDIEVHDFPKPAKGSGRSARLSIVSCPGVEMRRPTIDMLSGSDLPFQAGTGIELSERTPRNYGPVEGTHSEFEWALVIRRFADGPLASEEGDLFELRLVDAAGTPLQSNRNPLLHFSIPPGHVGGTFVENPGRIGPFQASNGDLYFIMEPAETNNIFMMVKSKDQGRTWHEIDGSNRPGNNDLESVDAHLVGDTIHILHQKSRTRYHTFRTSDHPVHPDTWAIRDEHVCNETDVKEQMVSLAVRSDGSLVAFFISQTINFSIRSTEGNWSPALEIEPAEERVFTGPQAVVDADDTVHLAYYGLDGTIWYRTLLPDNTLTPEVLLATGAGFGCPIIEFEFGAVLPLVYLPSSDTIVILYRLAEGRLWERRVVNGAEPTPAVKVTDRNVIRHTVDSMQPGADVVALRETLHLLFIDECTSSIYYTNDKDGWQPSTLQIGDIQGSWIRGQIYTRPDGATVYGFIYDAGSLGGGGMNRYDEVLLSDN